MRQGPAKAQVSIIRIPPQTSGPMSWELNNPSRLRGVLAAAFERIGRLTSTFSLAFQAWDPGY